jgi:hypothetical protein
MNSHCGFSIDGFRRNPSPLRTLGNGGFGPSYVRIGLFDPLDVGTGP